MLLCISTRESPPPPNIIPLFFLWHTFDIWSKVSQRLPNNPRLGWTYMDWTCMYVYICIHTYIMYIYSELYAYFRNILFKLHDIKHNIHEKLLFLKFKTPYKNIFNS